MITINTNDYTIREENKEYTCPSCYSDYVRRFHNYCPTCGKKIIWEGEVK